MKKEKSLLDLLARLYKVNSAIGAVNVYFLQICCRKKYGGFRVIKVSNLYWPFTGSNGHPMWACVMLALSDALLYFEYTKHTEVPAMSQCMCVSVSVCSSVCVQCVSV